MTMSALRLASLTIVISLLMCVETASGANVSYTPQNIPHTRLLAKIRADLPDPLIRPVYQPTKPTSINATIYIAQLVDVDDIEQKIKLNMRSYYDWHSDFVEWNPDDFGGIQSIKINPSELWTPDIESPSRVEDLKSPEVREDLVKVSHDGNMSWMMSTMITYSCQLNMSSFPSDEHQCPLILLFMGDEWPFVQFSSLNLFKSDYYIDNTEFNITDYKITLYGPVSLINMTIKRNPFLAGATLISPLVLLSALPPSSLLLPADDGSKLDIQINSMLAYAVYMMILSDYIPPFFNEQSPQLVSQVLKLIGINLVVLIYTVVALRLTNFDEFAPNKHVYKGIVYLGKLLLIYHPDRMCHASCKLRTKDNLISPSLIKVHPASEAGDVNSPEDKVREEGLTSHSLREIAEMIVEKNKTDEIKYQWCFIVAVMDRMTCIIIVVICITLGIKLYGISVS